MLKREELLGKVRQALASVVKGDVAIHGSSHLVDDLGLDSVKMATLTIALEDELDEVLLLNDWIASANSPSELTVDSLVTYLHELLSEGS